MPEQTGFEWDEVKTILNAAMDRPPAGRSAYLDDACRDRPALRDEVESLLAVHDRIADDDTLKSPFPAPADAPAFDPNEAARLGQVVGSHRITGIIGRGGMGVVYRAEHIDPRLAQRVAVKLLRRGFRPDDLRRFQDEQRILARLEHPNIARLLDAGVADDGAPYLVMEFVDGIPLLDYCEANHPDLRRRLELFETVCAAVQAAHTRLVVHRDLKPSNILVDREGRVKLLDFGIAKLLDDEADAPLTRTGQQLLTPEYASPEQFRGEPATTLSDVYSLGVLLYELLCGRRPYRLDGLTAAEAERVVCHEEPSRPSRTGQADSRRLAGDLDIVALTALSKSPARRYPSASHLADDLRRHREGLPILARPDTLNYRMTKFAARNRGPLFALLLVMLALVGGIIATARQAMETRRRFEEVRGLANTLLFDIQAEIRDLPGTTPLRRRIVDRALGHIDELARDAARDPGIKRELAGAYEQLGEIQGDPHFASLGDLAGADSTYRRALALREELVAANPTDAAGRRALANLLGRLGVVQSWAGDNGAAITFSRRALALLSELRSSDPGDDALNVDQARVRSELGWWRVWSGDVDGGLADIRASTTTFDSLRVRHPGDLELALALSDCNLFESDGLKFKGDYPGVVRILAPSVARLDALSLERPGHVRVRRKQLGALRQIGEGYEWTNPALALESYRRAVQVARDLFAVDGTSAATRRSLAVSCSQLGGFLLDARRYDDAVAALEEARRHQQWLRDRDPTNGGDANNLATTLMWMSQSLGRMRDYDRSLEAARAAVAVRDSMLALLKDDAATLANLATAEGAVGVAHQMRAEDPRTGAAESRAAWREAGAAYRAALARFARLQQEGRVMEYWKANRARSERGLASADSAAAADPRSSRPMRPGAS